MKIIITWGMEDREKEKSRKVILTTVWRGRGTRLAAGRLNRKREARIQNTDNLQKSHGTINVLSIIKGYICHK